MLIKESLWVVMDPWAVPTQSEDKELIKKMNILSWFFSNKIKYYLSDVTHKCISSNRDVQEQFSTWVNLEKPKDLHNYMLKNNLSKLTYCGFQHGKCIVFRDTGARYMSKFYNCYLKHDLSCVGISDDYTLDFYNPDRKSSKYMTFV